MAVDARAQEEPRVGTVLGVADCLGEVSYPVFAAGEPRRRDWMAGASGARTNAGIFGCGGDEPADSVFCSSDFACGGADGVPSGCCGIDCGVGFGLPADGDVLADVLASYPGGFASGGTASS